MGKFLFLAVMMCVAYALWAGHARARKRDASSGQSDPVSEIMVSCSVCAVNIPKSEAIERSGKFYCAEDHSSHKVDSQ